MECNRYELYRVHPKKLWPSSFRPTLRSSPSSELIHPMKSKLFWLFLRFECEVITRDTCFVHSNESNAEIHLDYVETSPNIVLKSSYGFMVHSEQTRHSSCRFFIPNCSCKIEITVPCDMPQQARALSLYDQSKQYRRLMMIIDDFWRSSLNWTSRTRCIICGYMTTFKFIHSIVYSRKRWCRCTMNIIHI